jgi:hypothetical protein
MKDATLFPNVILTKTLLSIGFVFMVPGQSLVLYSRLHLVVESRNLLRFVFWMILFNAVVLCVPIVTLNFHQHSARPEGYTRAYIVMVKVGTCIFTVQEIFISCIYIWEIHKTLKIIMDMRIRTSMWQLVAMNLLHLTLDTALLTVGFLNYYAVLWTFKGFAYSIKLLIEFAILTQLVRIVKRRKNLEDFAAVIPKSPDHELVQRAARQIHAKPVVQGNIPREWRVSVGISQFVSPSAPERESGGQPQSPTSTWSTDMYPGRLG